MLSIAQQKSSVSALKNVLRDALPNVKSSHLSEAIAHAMAYRTHAALIASLGETASTSRYRQVNLNRLYQRLKSFGYDYATPVDPSIFCSDLVPGIILTVPDAATNNSYSSKRDRAWRNLMVSAVNAALEHELITLNPSDPSDLKPYGDAMVFEFNIADGMPAKGAIRDIGHGELRISAAVNPIDDRVSVSNAGFHAGDAFGTTWLERKNGAFIQPYLQSFKCRRLLLPELTDLSVAPMGFRDRGAVIH